MPEKTRRGQTLVKGHTLRYEGQGFNEHGITPPGFHSREGYDRGMCSCGALSPPLPSNGARKRWHAEHKQEVLNAR